MLRGNWSSTMTSASAPSGVSSRARACRRGRPARGKKSASRSRRRRPRPSRTTCRGQRHARMRAPLWDRSPRWCAGPRSQPHLCVLDSIIELGVDAHEGLALRIVEVDRIGGEGRIEAFFQQVDLLLLEGGGDVVVFTDAQEYRPGIFGQLLREMVAQRRQVEVVLGDDRGHAGAAVTAGNLNAVDVGLQNAVELPDHLLDLGGRDVLAFPAESVADAIDEIEVAVLVLAHQIAGAEPDVALLEHVVQDLLVGLGLAGIALEPLAGLGRILHDLADDLARLVDVALDAEAAFVADRLLAFHVEAHDLGREARGDPPGKPADRAFLAVEIEQRDVAFGRGIELDDLWNLEAPLELRPHIGPQAVAASQAQMMRALFRVRRRVDEVTAQPADILKARAVPAHDV